MESRVKWSLESIGSQLPENKRNRGKATKKRKKVRDEEMRMWKEGKRRRRTDEDNDDDLNRGCRRPRNADDVI